MRILDVFGALFSEKPKDDGCVLIFHEMIRHEMVGNSKMWTKCRAVLRYVEASDI